MSQTILKYRLRQTYNTLTRSPRQKKLGWVISIAFIVPYYTMLTRSVHTVYGRMYESYGWQATARQVSVNLSMICFFVLVSTAALTLYRMFQARDLPLLMSLPAQDESLFWSKLVESLMDAGRSMILPLPFCLAFISVIGIFPAIIFSIGWIAVMFQLAGLSVIIALLLGRIIIMSRWGVLLRIVAVMAALAFLLIAMGYVHRAGSGIASTGVRSVAPLSRSTMLAILFPSSWLVALLPHDGLLIRVGLLYGLGFVVATVCCPMAALYFFKRRFRQLWMISAEVKQRGKAQKALKRRALSATGTMGSTKALIFKEMRVVRREPHIWIGLIIPLVLFPIFIFLRADAQSIQGIYIIVISLLTTASYSLSCIGREGSGFVILRSLPIRMSVLLRAKLFLGCVVNLTVTLAFVLSLYLARRLPSEQTGYNILIAVVVSVYLSAFGTALAALFPKFDFTNPIKAASLPGLLTLYLIAALFGFTFIGITMTLWYLSPIILFGWAGIAFVLMRTGQNRLEKMDI